MSNPRNMNEIPLTPGNYARIEKYAQHILQRGGEIPAPMIGWLQAADSAFQQLAPQHQHMALQQLEHERTVIAKYDRVQDGAVGRSEANQWFKEHSRGIGGQQDGANASKLREIAENKTTTTKQTRQVLTSDGVRKETVYKDSQKYSDSDARRAALVLAFAKHEARNAKQGGESFTNLDDRIDDAYLNSPHERQRDVANAMLEVETKASLGEPLPTGSNVSPASSDPGDR